RHRSVWMPLPTTLADISFLVGITLRSWQLSGHFNAEMMAAAGAVMLAFSVARYSRLHVLLSTVFSSAAYMLMCGVTDNLSAGRMSFVVGCYIALGLLIAWANGQ